MKKNCEQAQVELLKFESEDVIATSSETFSTKGTYGAGGDEWLSIGKD